MRELLKRGALGFRETGGGPVSTPAIHGDCQIVTGLWGSRSRFVKESRGGTPI